MTPTNNRLIARARSQLTPLPKPGARSTFATGRDKLGRTCRAGYGVQDSFAWFTPQDGAARGTAMRPAHLPARRPAASPAPRRAGAGRMPSQPRTADAA